ncbi:endonuclease/exonuclease/phosphatase family protein [Micromonospora sp. CPCC 205556]|uniref:endonuclease/exonuclease/phosphatase family protein n=1 Tax=Micromonospora sp. CPCC 205556 TaxID=3122398 RepID=UPI002FEEF39C
MTGDGPSRLRVLQLNLFNHLAEWERRREVLRAGLRALDPDLLALEETVVTADHDQVADLLSPDYVIRHQQPRQADGVGISIASRWPVEELTEIDLRVNERAARFPAAALVARVAAPAPFGPLVFVNHKPTWQYGFEYEREQQAVRTAREIERLVSGEAVHVVVAGDFDAVPDAASMRFWTGRQSLAGTSVMYRDAWEAIHPDEAGHTFTPRNPLVRGGEMPLELGRRIDYILVRCLDHGPTLRVADCRLAFAQPSEPSEPSEPRERIEPPEQGDERDEGRVDKGRGVWASDHFGVVADLTIA